MSFGALYATARSKTKRLVLEGVILGLASWAVGYLGWLPATGLMPPVWKHKPHQIAMPLAEHALFGVATVGGAISTNGLGFLGGKYGSMGAQVLAVEAVLADGTVFRTRPVSPHSTGIDLNHLVIGGEGQFAGFRHSSPVHRSKWAETDP